MQTTKTKTKTFCKTIEKIDDWSITGDIALGSSIGKIYDLSCAILNCTADSSITLQIKKLATPTAAATNIGTAKTIDIANATTCSFGDIEIAAGQTLLLAVTSETNNVRAIEITGKVI